MSSRAHSFRTVEDAWVAVRDGTRLAARLWLPAEGAGPAPAVLEAIPYRKRDGTRWRDAGLHGGLAERGFACVRLDLRGCGDSEGLLDDEYSAQEHADLADAIAWIAAQPWCTGRVGMIGLSWGGINALQMALLAPPALGAVAVVGATHDRAGLDAHWMGGALLGENLAWGTVLTALAARPPDGGVAGIAWRERWRRRLEALVPFAPRWMRRPPGHASWHLASLLDRPDDVRVPVLAMGGLFDPYATSVPWLVERVGAPCRGVVGPWPHAFPHLAEPGPPADFVGMAATWLGSWLRDGRAPDDGEPPLRAFVALAPASVTADRSRTAGHWVEPHAFAPTRVLHLGSGRALERDAPGVELDEVLVEASPRTLLATGAWCPFGVDDLPGDQREDDAAGAAFESEPLGERMLVFGRPEVELLVAPRAAAVQLCARLCDVAPDGSSWRIAYGIAELRRLEPRRPVTVRVPLLLASHALTAGHRLRLVLTGSAWPLAWPAPDAGAVHVLGGRLVVPVHDASGSDVALAPLPLPDGLPEPRRAELSATRPRRTVTRGAGGLVTIDWRSEGAPGDELALERLEGVDLEVGERFVQRFAMVDGDAASARHEVEVESLVRGPWGEARVLARSAMSVTRDGWRVATAVSARDGAGFVVEREWDEVVPRPG